MKVMKFCHLCFVLTLILPIFLPSVTRAGTLPDAMKDFAAWPVLHEGRIKTLDSFSRSVLYRISGDTKVNGMTSVEWLAMTLFDPAASTLLPIIRVDRVDLLTLEERKPPLYTMNEVMVALRPHQDLLMALDSMSPDMFTASQKRLYGVYAAISVYNQILQGFSAILALDGQENSFTYLSARDRMTMLQEKYKGRELHELTSDQDKEEFLLWSRLLLIAEGGRDNILFRFIPAGVNNASEPLVSLWETIDMGKGSPTASRITGMLSEMVSLWDQGDLTAWGERAAKIKDIIDSDPVWRLHHTPLKLKLEKLYVSINPVFWLIVIYMVVAGMMIAGKSHVAKWLCAGGLCLHMVMISIRIYILLRPPVATLYETLIFASLIVILCIWIISSRTGNYLLLLGGALAAIFLLVLSNGFVQGDSFNVLVAVLNTDFWLATHVICIVIGYALCVTAAMTGHFVLVLPYLQSKNYIHKYIARNTSILLLPMVVAALFLTSVGTLLGGIWADQSWGRFWGWDPKENGALLIVLWLAWILHGRVTGHFKKQIFAIMVALTNIPVALTWFGVNLLGVGLHSYGFISGIAYGLATFCVLQCFAVIGLALIYRKYAHVT